MTVTDRRTLSLLELLTEPNTGFMFSVQVYCIQDLGTPGGEGKQEEEAVMCAVSGQVHRVPESVCPLYNVERRTKSGAVK